MFLALAPPGTFGAHFCGLEGETFSLYHVEEYLAYEIGRRGLGHFQACSESEIQTVLNSNILKTNFFYLNYSIMIN